MNIQIGDIIEIGVEAGLCFYASEPVVPSIMDMFLTFQPKDKFCVVDVVLKKCGVSEFQDLYCVLKPLQNDKFSKNIDRNLICLYSCSQNQIYGFIHNYDVKIIKTGD